MRLLAALLAFAALLAPFLCVNGTLTVHLVPHTHDDVGWLKTVDQYYVGLNKTIDSSVVQYILTTVIDQLLLNPDRKFMYVEQAFFQRYWMQQTSKRQSDIKKLVANGQLEFINGGWCMHDEATTHWVDMVDQTTLGHRFLIDQFNVRPKATWQIDPFGHSATQASLLGGEAGFEAFFTARIDYADFRKRFATNATEWIWRSSPSLGTDAEVFSGIFQWADRQLYGPPSGFNWELYSTDAPIQDDPRLNDYNLDQKVLLFIETAQYQAKHNLGDNLLWNLGFDFNHEAAHEWFKQIDKLIAAVNANGTVQAQYSTPSIYTEAKNKENLKWPTKTDDLFPYANDPHSYWTGYFVSRPALKRYVRAASAQLQVLRQLEVLYSSSSDATEVAWENIAVAQHHDGVSGTSKQHVASDYAQRIAKGIAAAEEELLPQFASFITNANDTPAFETCSLTNVSICDVSQTNDQLVIALYNPLARQRTELVTVPIGSDGTGVTVSDSEGNTVAASVVPVFGTPALEDNSAQYQLSFLATVSGIGFNTYFVSHSSKSAKKAPSKAPFIRTVSDCASEAVTLSNGIITLSFDDSCQLKSWRDETLGQEWAFTTGFAYYPAYQSTNQQNSGAYIFRPSQQYAVPLVNMSATLTIIDTDLVKEARLTVNEYISSTIRLIFNSSVVEHEWTVGPVDINDGIGKEVIIQYNSTTLASGQNATWYTDSNGREFQKRVRDYRPTWTLDRTEPISENYYPVNAAAYVNTTQGVFSVVVDRSQGVASQADGSLELMVHRRLLFDDNRGVGEPMNETSSQVPCDPSDSVNCPWGIIRLGKPLVITGIHRLQLTPQGSLLPVRAVQNRAYSPLVPLIAPLTTTVNKYRASHQLADSALINDFPVEVEISHLHAWRKGSVLLRLAHNFGIGDDNTNVDTVDIDLKNTFATPITDVTELSITANAKKSDIKPLQWQTQDNAGESSVKRVSGLKGDATVSVSAAEVRTFQVTFANANQQRASTN